MTRKKLTVVIVVITMVVLMTINLMKATGWDQTVLFPVSRVLRETTAPLQKGVTSLKQKGEEVFAYFSDSKILREENVEMRKKIAELEEQVFTLKDFELENDRLKDLLEYKEQRSQNYNLIMAKTIGRDPSNWYNTIILNKGSKDGIKPNMPVVNHEGLVGIVINATSGTSEVLLILDVEGAVGGRIFENRIAPGVVIGTGKSGLLQMIHLPHDAPVDSGQTVVTSGLGRIFPKGIRIGKVEEVEIDVNGLMKTAYIKPFVDFNQLEEVFIITQVKNAETDTALEELGDQAIPDVSGNLSGMREGEGTP